MLDDLAGEAAQRALELRGLAEKGARSRKKKALVDFMHALAAAGASAKRSAVPATERGMHAWFSQVWPMAIHAILPRLPLEGHMKGLQGDGTSEGESSTANVIGYAGEPGCGCEGPAGGEQWGSPGCLSSSAKESALALWSKADAYYFCNVARMQRVWQVSACSSQPPTYGCIVSAIDTLQPDQHRPHLGLSGCTEHHHHLLAMP